MLKSGTILPVEFEEQITTDELIAYPNPVANVLNINFNTLLEGSFQLKMSDVLGRLVYQNEFTKKEASYKRE